MNLFHCQKQVECHQHVLNKKFPSDVYIRIMIENEIFCYINSFLKWNISKTTSYIIGNKIFFGKICILKEGHKGNRKDYN